MQIKKPVFYHHYTQTYANILYIYKYIYIYNLYTYAYIYIYTNIKKHGSTYIFEKYPPKNATCLICKITLGGCESVITTRNEATSQCTVPSNSMW